ncbi:Uma2 family endonuclease [Azospirillum agricola]|uniref:Uma2 family endonuclease n=1 Tax=Azospirillum agricola TaxID=1720247 RepID=UPI001AE8CA4D|nr:Uma2 family endonuclease [Azospirillum agricola]MBP2228332.1 Uma2 family endonuclease [Azospirillum agricola]
MPNTLRKVWISPGDYLAAERTAELRHEYVDGEIFAMVGASRRHAGIVARFGFAIRQAALRRGCDAFLNDVKVRVEAANAYYYPDIVATCHPGDDDPYVVEAPVLVVEVLSDSTEAVDRREKRVNYQTIPSLREIVLVAQNERRIEIYRREGGGWVADIVTEGEVTLAALDLSLPLAAVYED